MTKFYLSFSRYLTVLLVMVSTIAWSQSRTVTGKVISADDESGLPGVNVVEKGTSNGTVTDVDGNYSINVGENATLVFSFVGFASQEVAVGAQSSVNVTLSPDVRALSEVVVIGYGEVNRRDATGAVASVKAEDFNTGIISSPEQLIQGKTAGVQITSNSGEPGAGVNLRIRGTSSVRGGNNPLFVVDGIPLSGENVTPGGGDFGRGGQSAKNPLNFINPNDIESIDILKDASATAIYGSRGANGVVIITTKSGKGKKNNLEYSGNTSFSVQAKTYDLLSADEFRTEYAKYGNLDAVDYGSNTDWQDQINQTAISQNHNLAYSNSYKAGNYRVALSYDDQEGIIKNSGMERYTGRLNLNHAWFDNKLKFGAQTILSRVRDRAAPVSNNSGYQGDLIATSIFYNPTIPAVATDYDITTPENPDDPNAPESTDTWQGDASNPLAQLAYIRDRTYTSRALVNLSLGYDITKELNVKINTGIDRSVADRGASASGLLRKFNDIAGFGRSIINHQENNNDLLELFMTYQKNFGANSLTVLGGYSYQRFDVSGYNATANNFGPINENLDQMIQSTIHADAAVRGVIPSNWQRYQYERGDRLRVYNLFGADNLPYVVEYPAANGLPLIASQGIAGDRFSRIDELQSYFGRVNYNVGEKYFLTASLRADGSTKFGGNNKYGYFPSAAAKWRLSEEDFLPELFDDLALRVGYGITGNQEIPHNLHQGRINYVGAGMTREGNIPDGDPAGTANVAYQFPDLQWEQTSQLNVGLDFGFFSSRLSGSIDVYNKNTTDLLILVRAAQPAPNPFYWTNLDANVINSGVELALNAVAVDQQDLDVNVGFNIAYNENMVKNYNQSPLNTGEIHGQGLTGAFAQRLANNQPLFSYYVREWTGFGEDGLNEGSDEQTFIGKGALPKINLGFSLSARFKAFDFAAYLNGQYGHYIYNNVANAMFTKGSLGSGRNITKDAAASTENVSNAPDVSTRFLEKGDFLRMQNLSIGYNFSLPSDSFIKKLRLSAIGSNLFVITSYTGLDPEVNVDKNLDGVPSLGIDYTAYPRARTLTIGLNANF